jgi:Na+:H+ antiporter, NhaA family
MPPSSYMSGRLSDTFRDFFRSEKSGGILLIVCTVISLIITNSALGENYLAVWHAYLGGLTVEHWINDGLMAIFFLLIGLELEREFYNGELSDIKSALLPIFAAAGGILVPALIHLSLNFGSGTQPGVGIPMATDIAFALGVLALLGDRVPASLKIFLAALAVIDDLGAIMVIAFFYTAQLSILYLAAGLAVFIALILLNRFFRVMALLPYLIGGALMWFLLLRSGVHATVAGVLLAFTIPFSHVEEDRRSPSHRLEHFLHKPVAFLILPVFALANTGIVIGVDWVHSLSSANGLGIIFGLLAGKPAGIILLSFLCVAAGLCRLPADLNWKHILGAGFLGGIGFTMSIFITNLAFTGDAAAINASKMAILAASIAAGAIGFFWLRTLGRPAAPES